MDISFRPSSAPFPGDMAQLGTAGLSLDFQVIGKAAAVLQLPTVNSNNGQEDSGPRVRALLPALPALGPPSAPFHGFVPMLAGWLPTLCWHCCSQIDGCASWRFLM